MNLCLRILLLLSLLLPIVQNGLAQQLAESDLLLTPNQLLEEDLSGVGNSTYVQQVGTENSVDILQQQTGDTRINLVRVLQFGDYNHIYISQEGSGNQTAVIQRGSDNLYQSEVEGFHNNIAVIQDGDHNRIIQNLINSSEIQVEFVQEGSDNEIIQNLNGTNAQQFKIIQIGEGLRAIINHDPRY